MSYKDILVFLDDGSSNADRINAAFELAKTHGANLTGVALASMKPVHAKVDDEQAIARMADKLSQQLIENFTQAAAVINLNVSSIIISGDAANSALKMAHYSRNYDLIILTQPNPARDNYSRLKEFAQQVLIHSGRPILFVPYIGVNKFPFEKALIAWDGTPAASRSVHDAIPLLAKTQKTIILVVASKKQKHSKKEVLVEGLETHLANHQVNAQIQWVNPGDNNVATVILNQITDNDINLLVLGGHGTPSLKQKIFGGVTTTLLSSMIVPVLMSD